MQILAATDITAGAEIHNTYGEQCTPSLDQSYQHPDHCGLGSLGVVQGPACLIADTSAAGTAAMLAPAGEYGNAELLHKYGFVLRDNPFDVVTLDRQHVLDTAGGSPASTIPSAPPV